MLLRYSTYASWVREENGRGQASRGKCRRHACQVDGGKQDQERLLIFERLLDFSDDLSRKRRYPHCLDLKEKLFLSENKIRNFSLQLLHWRAPSWPHLSLHSLALKHL